MGDENELLKLRASQVICAFWSKSPLKWVSVHGGSQHVEIGVKDIPVLIEWLNHLPLE